MNYKAADRCNDCPKCNNEDGCPWWWEIVQRGDSGDVHVTKRCGKAWLPEILIEVTKSLLRPQAAFESMRNVLQPLMDVLSSQGEVTMLRVEHGRDRLGIAHKAD